MSSSRTFSDTEIITIATVAAAALGGIVVGLGRGQEEHREQVPSRAKLSERMSQLSETGRDLVPDLTGTRSKIEQHDFGSDLKRALRAVQSTGESVAQRASLDARPSHRFSSVSDRLPSLRASRRESVVDHLKALGLEAFRTGVAKFEETDWNQVRESAGEAARRVKRGAETAVESDEPDGERLVAQIGDELEAVGHRISSAPEAARSAAVAARSRVSEPVSRAASSAGDATKESLAALAWLGVGSAIVYFGLLSDERREQVKAAICGAYEQGRLLVLDFQGYEPEM